MLETLALAASIAAIAGVAGTKLRPIPADSAYVGSASCETCHSDQFAAWSGSLHSQMMRSVDAEGVVVADFSLDDSVSFDRDEAVWAIGGKWEQQFMGHEDGRDTLLPGAWRLALQEWDFKGWDGWQVPDPVRRCHGCHTVGLDAETGDFVEPSIGCESCHGPAEWHVSTFGVGRISALTDAQVCGQCHTRGTTESGEFFFPVGYRPGDDLDASFRHAEPTPEQNSTFWFGNGHERKRHQEYIAWKAGGHSNSLRSLRSGKDDGNEGGYDGRYGEVTDDCLACHAGDFILAQGAKPSVDEVEQGITCAVCHNAHGSLDELRMECADCHLDGASVHNPGQNATHVPCPDGAEVGCVDCHMPVTVKVGGVYALHDHSPGLIPPSDTTDWGTVNSCSQAGCHANLSTQQLQDRFDTHFSHK